jgi:hypothetical protein
MSKFKSCGCRPISTTITSPAANPVAKIYWMTISSSVFWLLTRYFGGFAVACDIWREARPLTSSSEFLSTADGHHSQLNMLLHRCTEAWQRLHPIQAARLLHWHHSRRHCRHRDMHRCDISAAASQIHPDLNCTRSASSKRTRSMPIVMQSSVRRILRWKVTTFLSWPRHIQKHKISNPPRATRMNP